MVNTCLRILEFCYPVASFESSAASRQIIWKSVEDRVIEFSLYSLPENKVNINYDGRDSETKLINFVVITKLRVFHSKNLGNLVTLVLSSLK